MTTKKERAKVVMVLRTEGAVLTIYNTATNAHIKLIGQFVRIFKEADNRRQNVSGQS